MAMLDKLRELCDDTGLLKAEMQSFRGLLPLSQQCSTPSSDVNSGYASTMPTVEADSVERKERERSVVIANIPESKMRLPSERVDEDVSRTRTSDE
ncbi:hypothetical protein Q1695_004227 [Nippostrongylus brasiliensis]|nr:hypothetical protein Q1695_004227 [Nippostrongylus brasiliensis]